MDRESVSELQLTIDIGTGVVVGRCWLRGELDFNRVLFLVSLGCLHNKPNLTVSNVIQPLALWVRSLSAVDSLHHLVRPGDLLFSKWFGNLTPMISCCSEQCSP